ncbi:CCR4-NOT transcription complex subunit 10-like [Salvia divinorum]|uniref:CCR4-NOT transcription complex subunit 10-like n=1 Tax=Salvia divinorum TaxID=28513 RepID=A0ABD1GXU5_SALDI
MDSPPASVALNTRDGSPSAAAGVDDGALFLEGLAKEAAVLFQSGKFADCLRILDQLLQKKENDPKVFHNVAIAESLQDGCSDPRKLIKALEKIKEQSEELACASEEHLEVYYDEWDTSVATFNIAVIWYHLHEYARSFSYLDTLYQIIEPIDEGTALRICLLLLDVALLSHNASRSADVISYIERIFFVSSPGNQADNGSSAHQQPLLVSKSTSLPNNLTIHDGSHPDSTSDDSLTRTLSEEALEDEPLPLLSSLDISGQNLQRPGIVSANDLQRIQPEGSISTADLRLKLHLYKVRFLLLTRNLKAAKREVKMAMNLARGKDYPLALYLKSQLEYARGNHRKAIKLLMASSNSTEMGIPSMYYNDLGCIYYRLGKLHTSGVLFSKALSNSSAVRKEKPPKLLTLSQDKSLLITYNCGIQSLACGRPFHAARCFQMASLIFYNRPLLWLRIAECCLMALDKGLIKSSSASAISEIGVNVIGKGKWRQLALRYGPSNGHGIYVGMNSSVKGDGKQPDLSMSLAWQSLVNALFLLDSSEANYFKADEAPVSEEKESGEAPLSQSSNLKNATGGDPKAPTVASGSSLANANGEVKEHKGGQNLAGTLANSILDYEHICMKENLMIRQAVLADLAFVELALGDPLKALSTARSLLNLPDCSKMYIFLGTMYAAEALCLLNRPNEAAEHLLMYIPDGNNVKLPYSQEDCEKWTVEKVADTDESNGGTAAVVSALSTGDESQAPVFSSSEEARGLFCANFAANFALLGDFEQAQRFLTMAFSDIPNSAQAILTAIYVDIKRGNTQDALAKLRQHKGVRFVPGNLTLNGSC